MKSLSTILVSALFVGVSALTTTAAHAWPGAGPNSRLDYSARNLTAAAQYLQSQLQYMAPNSDAANDAETLYLATTHFQEEVELGPVDLDVDFNTIEQTFNQLQYRLTRYGEYQRFPQVRDAWFRVEEANIQLRQSWQSGGPTPPPVPPRGDYACIARNLRGQTFEGHGYIQAAAADTAMRFCLSVSLRCTVVSCAYQY